MRHKYLNDSHVIGFIDYLTKIVNGNIPIKMKVGFSKNKLPKDFSSNHPGGKFKGKGAGSVYEIEVESLEKLFGMYWWDRAYYDENAKILHGVAENIKNSIDRESFDDGHVMSISACREVMSWGFGKGTVAYRANISWAEQLGFNLISTLRLGRESLSGDNPNYQIFGKNSAHTPQIPRMNSGWTKYYALAIPGFIIYDGRVGAALGFLVRRYIESLDPTIKPKKLPDSLAFPWAPGQGTKLRNPSSDQYIFPQLRHTDDGMRDWARCNLQANWILIEVMKLAKVNWLSGDDGLRKFEASLFMLGYDLSHTHID